MAEPLATVNLAVHYVSYGTPGGEFPSVCRAAIVTEVNPDGTVSLCVFNPTGLFFNTGLRFDPARAPGTWHHTCPF